MASKDAAQSRAADIYKLLPGRDCGRKSPCRLPKCMLFARELLTASRDVYDCPYLKDDNRQEIMLILDEYFR